MSGALRKADEDSTNFALDDPTLLLREDVLTDPRPLYDELRRRAPVWQLPGQETYLVSDPDLVRDAVGRAKEFSSNLVSIVLIIGMDRTPKGRIWGCWTGTGDKKDGYFLLATSDDGGATWTSNGPPARTTASAST